MKQTPFLAALLLFTTASALTAGSVSGYSQNNLVSDIPGLAANTDPNLVNPWGISESGTSPFWISDNGKDLSTLYNSSGTPLSLVVSIPGGAPTGQVFNSTTNFNSDRFIFASESGNITGWRGALGTTAETLYSSSNGAVFKGLANGTTAQGSYLYAADFHNNQITVLPGTGAPALSGNFTDPNLPPGYAPFNIQNLNGQLYVTYAKQDAAGHDDVPGAGNGFVDVYDLNGNFVKRLISDGALNSPWGMALAPVGFGAVGGDLLVGNFGDGAINAFSPDGTFIGALAATNGTPLLNDGLWGLTFGNGGNGGDANLLYLTAGLNGEADGLFAEIGQVPEPATYGFLVLGLGLLAWRRRVRTN